ncbi:MAG: efflux RND transporter periplasmic adaptor subunit [Acidobacteriia bacterium]|nr:efflux RND transporter periplasmic adaptor subunit [Terriglobia bacterium]
MKKLKWLLGFTLLIAALALGGFTYYTRSKKAEFLKAKVTRGDLESAISATGSLAAVISVPVGSQVSGNVAAVYVDFNSVVKKNQLVAQIDPAPFQTKVDQAKANLDNAKAQITNAEVGLRKADLDIANAELNITNQKAAVVRSQSQVNDAKRKKDLQDKMLAAGVTTKDSVDSAQAVYDQAVASLESAQAQVKSAQASLESVKAQRQVAETQKITAAAQVATADANLQNAQLDLEHTRITSPVDGVVIARNTDVGQTVQASYSVATLFTIAQDLTKMHVETNIDESDISRVQEDQLATFTVDAYPGQTFRGTVMQVRHAPTNVQNVITYTVVINVDNPDLKLFPGMTANVRLVTDRLSAAIKIPAAALRFRPPEDLLPPDAKNTDKKVVKGDGKFDPSQFKGGDGKFDPSQFKGRGGGGFGGGGGGGRRGGNGGGGGGGQINANQGGVRAASQFQTVYTLDEKGQLKAERIRTGISDGNFVAMLGGNLKEGQELVTGIEGVRAGGNQNKNAPGFPGGNQNNFKQGRGGLPF